MNFKDFKKNYQVKLVQEFSNLLYDLPFLSICIQTYEHESYIRKCLDGILIQKTTFPFEILLGEDDSTDGTREICIEYAKKYPDKIRLFLHHRENNIYIDGSPTGRFNFVYNYYSARGKYIALCEGDDYWTDPYKLQKQVDFLEQHEEYVLSFHKVKIRTKNGELVDDFITKVPEDYSNLKDFAANGNYIHTPSVVFRNTPINFPLEYSYVSFGDYFLYFLLGIQGKFHYHEEYMAVYRHGVGVISKMKIKEILLNNMRLYTAMISCSPNDEIKQILLERQKEIFEFYYSKSQKGADMGVKKHLKAAAKILLKKYYK